jgi:hypothetical protein
VVGDIRGAVEFWRSMGTSNTVVQWILDGVPIRWNGSPPERRCMRNSRSAFAHRSFVDGAVTELLSANAIRQVFHTPAVVSPLGVVPKIGTKKLRLIVNLRYVNKAMVIPRFRMESLSDLSDLMELGDFMISFDLKSYFGHVPLAESAQQWVAFEWPDDTGRPRYFEFLRLPFGLATAPWAFTKLMRQLVNHWRRSGVRVLPYLDDFLFMSSSYASALDLSARVQSDFRNCGLLVNMEKSVSKPVNRLKHLGMMVDTSSGVFEVPVERWDKLMSCVSRLQRAKRGRVGVRDVAACVGQILSMKVSLGMVVHLFTRFLYQVIDMAPTWSSYVTLSSSALEELSFWAGLSRTSFTGPIWPPLRSAVVQLATDASNIAWGSLLLHTVGQSPPVNHVAHEFFEPWERSQSSSMRELMGVLGSLRAFLPWCRDAVVFCQTDCQNLVPISQRGSRSLNLNVVSKQLFWFCLENRITLHVHWVPREQNQEADDVSKLLDGSDWRLHPGIFDSLNRRWGPHTVDLFASSKNAHCERFFSRFWCPGTSGVDAFSHDWSLENSWINPPFSLIGRVWRRLRSMGASASMVVPIWTASPWWHLIAPDGVHLDSSVVDWVWLPRWDLLFSPGNPSKFEATSPSPRWQVIAIRVCFSTGRFGSLSSLGRCTIGGCRSCRGSK